MAVPIPPTEPPETTPRPGSETESKAEPIDVEGTAERPWGQTPEPGNPTAALHPGEAGHRRLKEAILQPAALLPHTTRRNPRQE